MFVSKSIGIEKDIDVDFIHTHLKSCTLSMLSVDCFQITNNSTLQNCLIEDAKLYKLKIKKSAVKNTTFKNISHKPVIRSYESDESEDDMCSIITDNEYFSNAGYFIAKNIIAENIEFENCKLKCFFVNSTFHKLHINATQFNYINISHCTLSEANFENSYFDELQCGVKGQLEKAKRTIFKQCTFHNNTVESAEFANTDFIDSKLEKSLTESQFKGTTLDEKTLRKSYSKEFSLFIIMLALAQFKK